MNLMQIAPLYEVMPPELYGGTEGVVADLRDALIELGHEVAPFAAADERRKARLVAARDHRVRRELRGGSARAAITRMPFRDRGRVRAVFDRRFEGTTMARAYPDVYVDCPMRSGCPRVAGAAARGCQLDG